MGADSSFSHLPRKQDPHIAIPDVGELFSRFTKATNEYFRTHRY
jgi:hypothetical protein